jgi:hypothetical protein
MSRLTLYGNIIKNLGEFLPAPYVEKITLKGEDDSSNQYAIRTGVMVKNKSEVVVYENGEIVNDEVSQASDLENLNFYVMAFHVNSEKAEALAEDDESFGKRLPVKYYEEIINGDLNPFQYYALTGSTIYETINEDGQRPYRSALLAFNPFDSEPETLYDETGAEYFLYTQDVAVPLSDGDGIIEQWGNVGDLKFIVFSSTYDYYSNYTTIEEDELVNLPFFNLKVSDISFESVYDDGALETPVKTLYFDTNNNIYSETPLISIDLTPFKINQIDNEDIIADINTLLDDYQTQYNQETGFDDLKKVMDNIYFVLETKRYDPGIVVALNQVAISFPDKTPIKPVGKLYRRFRNKIFSINTQVRNSEPLTRKQIYASKVFDERFMSAENENIDTLYIDSNLDSGVHFYSTTTDPNLTEQFLYKDWAATAYANAEMQSSDIDVVFGTFFFDYEKALRRSSNVSKVFDVDKLENWGMPIPWRKFYTTFAEVNRTDDEGGTQSVMCSFDTTESYPLTDLSYLRETYIGTTVPAAKQYLTPSSYGFDFGDSPYNSPNRDNGAAKTEDYDAENGSATSLVFRQFLDPSNGDSGYGINRGKIDDYRMMMFQLLEYRGVPSLLGAYNAAVYLEDKTVDIVNSLTASCRIALNDIKEYYEYATEICSYNNVLLRYNQFFIDEMKAVYGDGGSNSPWYRATFIYEMHSDLLYDTHEGSLESIKTAAQSRSFQIDPVNGNPDSLIRFVDDFESLVNSNYGPAPGDVSVGLYSRTIKQMQSVRQCCYVETLNDV